MLRLVMLTLVEHIRKWGHLARLSGRVAGCVRRVMGGYHAKWNFAGFSSAARLLLDLGK
jgi:hypothetical protein